jgi:cytochrome P450
VTDPGFEYDPYSYEIDADPYPLYRRMRDEAPLYRNERLDFWALTRFDDCLAAFLDWQTFSSAQGTVLELMDDERLPGSMIIFMDPPRQTRYRNVVSKAFTPARIRALESRIRAIAVGHLEKLEGRSRFDVVEAFTARLPMDVISTMLGIPEEDRDTVREWSNAVLHREAGSPLPTEHGMECMAKMHRYVQGLLEERRRRPRDDMASLLLEAEVDGCRLSDAEIRSFVQLLATAGNETVTKLLASALYWLDRAPDQRRLLVRDPGLCRGAVEEFLRLDPPSHYQGRVVARPVTLHGVTLPVGAKVLIVNGASGRDERKFPDPDRLDVRREIDLHLGFGYGRHICLGASLARMESRIALEELLARWPEYAVPESGVRRMHSSNVRGLAGLVLEVEAA